MSVFDVIREEHKALKRAVHRNRNEWRKSHSELVRSVYTAWEFWDAQKAEGVSLAERLTGLQKTIRACWPFTREWKFLCKECDDIGLIFLECDGDAMCGRTYPHLPHRYGKPCWCSLGAKFKPAAKPTPDDFLQAGKGKSKPMSRFGR